MKFTRSFIAIMAVAALSACDDDPTDEGDVEIDGEYTVSEFRYTADAAGGPTVDLASVPGPNGPYGILEMTVAADNSFAGVLRLPTAGGPMNFNIGGDIDLTSDTGITIDFNDATNALDILDPEESGTYSLSGNTLTIILPEVTFDFGALAGTPSGDTESNLRIVGTRS